MSTVLLTPEGRGHLAADALGDYAETLRRLSRRRSAAGPDRADYRARLRRRAAAADALSVALAASEYVIDRPFEARA